MPSPALALWFDAWGLGKRLWLARPEPGLLDSCLNGRPDVCATANKTRASRVVWFPGQVIMVIPRPFLFNYRSWWGVNSSQDNWCVEMENPVQFFSFFWKSRVISTYTDFPTFSISIHLRRNLRRRQCMRPRVWETNINSKTRRWESESPANLIVGYKVFVFTRSIL